MKDETKCLHSGYTPGNTEPRVVPIVQSTTYRFDTTQDIADVFDAIVSKRQYKTHVSISETLKILIKDSEPSRKSIALDALNTQSKYGKINKNILKVLFKVVIDDTNYEISCIMEYVSYLKEHNTSWR